MSTFRTRVSEMHAQASHLSERRPHSAPPQRGPWQSLSPPTVDSRAWGESEGPHTELEGTGLVELEARRTQRPEQAGPVGPWTPRGHCGRISRQAEDAGDGGVSVLRVWAGSWAEAGLHLSDMQLPAAHVHPGDTTSQNRTAKWKSRPAVKSSYNRHNHGGHTDACPHAVPKRSASCVDTRVRGVPVCPAGPRAPCGRSGARGARPSSQAQGSM